MIAKGISSLVFSYDVTSDKKCLGLCYQLIFSQKHLKVLEDNSVQMDTDTKCNQVLNSVRAES